MKAENEKSRKTIMVMMKMQLWLTMLLMMKRIVMKKIKNKAVISKEND